MSFGKSAISLLILAMIFLLITGCVSSQSPTPTPATSTSATSTVTIPNTNIPSINSPTSTPIITSPILPEPTATKFYQAPAVIDKNSNGQEVHVNLIKFVGSVSSPGTNVLVNSIQAPVNNDGSYYAYLDLVPGENSIEVKTTINQTTTSDHITVIFRPPLVVELAFPYWNSIDDKDYTKVPLEIHGAVSDPAARVEINHTQVPVKNNGAFSLSAPLEVGSNMFHAAAYLEAEIDTDVVQVVVFDNGKLSPPPPGLGAGTFSYVTFNNDDHVINIKAGETIMAPVEILSNKNVFGFRQERGFEVNVIRTSQPHPNNHEDQLPVLPALIVDFNPPNYKLYPKIEYRSLMVIKAGLDLAPGEYYFTFDYSIVAGRGQDYFTVKVN